MTTDSRKWTLVYNKEMLSSVHGSVGAAKVNALL